MISYCTEAVNVWQTDLRCPRCSHLCLILECVAPFQLIDCGRGATPLIVCCVGLSCPQTWLPCWLWRRGSGGQGARTLNLTAAGKWILRAAWGSVDTDPSLVRAQGEPTALPTPWFRSALQRTHLNRGNGTLTPRDCEIINVHVFCYTCLRSLQQFLLDPI